MGEEAFGNLQLMSCTPKSAAGRPSSAFFFSFGDAGRASRPRGATRQGPPWGGGSSCPTGRIPGIPAQASCLSSRWESRTPRPDTPRREVSQAGSMVKLLGLQTEHAPDQRRVSPNNPYQTPGQRPLCGDGMVVGSTQRDPWRHPLRSAQGSSSRARPPRGQAAGSRELAHRPVMRAAGAATHRRSPPSCLVVCRC